MRRMILLLTVVSLMVVMLAMSAAPAFAAKSPVGELFSNCATTGDSAYGCTISLAESGKTLNVTERPPINR